MKLLNYAEKRGYYNNWLLTIALPELNKKFKKNESMKQRWFILKAKITKWITLLDKEQTELDYDLKKIIW